jgi:hypothetical protein
MKPPFNIDHERDEDNIAPNEKSAEEKGKTPGGYYYDDTTGYEVFTGEDEEENETPARD